VVEKSLNIRQCGLNSVLYKLELIGVENRKVNAAWFGLRHDTLDQGL